METKYKSVVEQIQRLAEEQHRLYLLAAKHELTDAQRRRLVQIKAELPGLWLDRKQERTRFQDPVNEFVDQWYNKAV
jgi:hypothetical protein